MTKYESSSVNLPSLAICLDQFQYNLNKNLNINNENLPLEDILGFKRIIHFYNLWFAKKHIPNTFLLLKYEELLENGVESLMKVNLFFNLNILKSDIERIYLASSADKMRKKEIANQLEGFNDFGKSRNQLKVRNAKIGGYKSELSEQDIFYCNKEMRKLNTYFGYRI